MDIDIVLVKAGAPIKNGSILINSKKLHNNNLIYNTYDAIVKNTPTISEIESKYSNRFNHPSYYYGDSDDGVGGDVDGGNVGDVVVGG